MFRKKIVKFRKGFGKNATFRANLAENDILCANEETHPFSNYLD